MGYCTNCGEPVEAARFCTSCGHPAEAPAESPADDTATSERPPVPAAAPPAAAPPAAPPPPTGLAPPPRFPLYADEVGQPPVGQPPAGQPAPAHTAGPRRRLWWPWLVLAAVLVLVAVVVVVGVVSRGEDGSTGAAAPTGRAGDKEPGAAPTGSLASRSSVEVPATAPANQDTAGRRTTYVGANLLDGVPETCWRMPGDGTGDEITVTLPHRTHLRTVGLINGYAKTAADGGQELDWYHGNRRVLEVEWVFDDGTTTPQQLSDTTAVQSVDVDVTTRTIVLRLVRVSAPGKGPASRDYTAISDLVLVAD